MVTEFEYRVLEQVDENGRILRRLWKTNHSDALHRCEAPAQEEFDPASGRLVSAKWIDQSKHGLHRAGGLPAAIEIDPNSGVVTLEQYFLSGLEHKSDGGPSKVIRDATSGQVVLEEHRIHGELSRLCGLPAITEYCEDSGQPVRLEFFVNGVRHREHGPAIVEFDENQNVILAEFFEDGQQKGVPQLGNPQLDY